MTFKDYLAYAIGFLVGWTLVGLLDSCAPPPITAAQADDVQQTGSKIAHCQTVGRNAKSYTAYECCMIAAGLTPGRTCIHDTATEFGNPVDAGGDAHGD